MLLYGGHRLAKVCVRIIAMECELRYVSVRNMSVLFDLVGFGAPIELVICFSYFTFTYDLLAYFVFG